uniref:TB2/DP1, HVA22 family protein n=1 Tax=Spironucleus salmonicida TaxID=348837 RepID=V6LY48_9EUKA|eukprot:EST49495.1 hypothetical protein SS50377_10093 [Spironucleus salmonicida]
MSFSNLTTFVQRLYSIMFPVYLSVQSYKSPEPTDDIQWLSYWCIYGLFMLLENLIPIAKKFTFYSTIKLGILVWLINKRGSVVIYNKVMKPAFIYVEKNDRG